MMKSVRFYSVFIFFLIFQCCFAFSNSFSHQIPLSLDYETENEDTLRINRMMKSSHHAVVYSIPDILKEELFFNAFNYDSLRVRVISIISVGDIMPGTNYPSEKYLPSDCSSLFDPVRDVLVDADVTIGNLEGVFSSVGGTPKNCKNPETCYVFRMPDEYAECIKDAGFDILGTANNHVNDFGITGRKNTARQLKKSGFKFAGFRSHPFTIYETKGVKIGFCSFAPHTGTMNFKDYEEASRLVEKLSASTDLVVVNFHSGAEGKDHQHITREDEVFLGHNRGNVYLFSRKMIDAGADLVVGHGPHVVRALDFYKGKLIAYSLGNFCTYARFNLSGPNANAPALKVWLSEKGEFKKARIFSFSQYGEGGPVPDPDGQAIIRMRYLTEIDIPEAPLKIDENGWIMITE